MPRAVITGITGQDGSYLAEHLLARGYEVFGVVRRTSHHSYERIEHLLDRIRIVTADLLDQHSLTQVIQETDPDEVYNLAAQSFVPTSFTQPVLTGEFTALGVTRILEAIRLVKPTARFYQASSTEMFGKVPETPQRESTPFYPRSPYGVAKVYGHWFTVNYRETYGIFAVERDPLQSRVAPAGHRVRHPEGHRRGGPDSARAGPGAPARQPRGEAGLGLRRRLRRGHVANAPGRRAPRLRVGTGVTHTVRELVEVAFAHAGLDWREHVVTDPAFSDRRRWISWWPIRAVRGTSWAGARRWASRSWSG